jgi:gamma-tubulin complex component 2
MLLDIIFNECKLMQRLDSMKHHFFLDRGDFFSVLVNGSEELFEKAREQVSDEKLDSYLQMAVKQSSLRNEPFQEDVSCSLKDISIAEQLFVTRITSGAAFQGKAGQGRVLDPSQLRSIGQQRSLKVYEALTLEYSVQWPLSLVISKKILNKYQLIFRHLLFQKYVENSLERAWSIH